MEIDGQTIITFIAFEGEKDDDDDDDGDDGIAELRNQTKMAY